MTTCVSARSRRRAVARGLVVLLSTAGLAGALLPAPGVAQDADGGVTAARIQGVQRFETAARIANRAFEDVEVAILVTGLDFPDALAGSFAAGRVGGPILLVERDNVPASTLGMLDELGVARVVLLGGRAAIGEEVERTLEKEGYPFQRIAGDDRYETAAEIARRYGQDSGTRLDGQRAAILASGETFPDALSAGPLAARADLPLLLTPRDRALAVVDDTLAELGIERLIVVGGEGAVSGAVVTHYEQAGYTVERLSGPTRDATATVVADNATARFEGFSDRVVLLSRGDDFPDALAASVYGAVLGAPILLTANPEVLGEATQSWLAGRCPEIEVVRALGGRGAVSVSTLEAAVDAAERCRRPDEEVARFTTQLLGDPDRTHNIHLAADYIDGDVVVAGTTYSLNEGIGRRTRARGFREVDNGCIGADGQAVDCVGGGVSQLATTFMNVAWFTGIDFHEFRQHTIYFHRYPVCHEATLSWGSIDVVVHNDSPYDIVIDTFYDDQFVGVRFVSRQWAQVESWAEPQDPPQAGGFASRCGRTITYPDGTTDEESYSWTYDDTGF